MGSRVYFGNRTNRILLKTIFEHKIRAKISAKTNAKVPGSGTGTDGGPPGGVGPGPDDVPQVPPESPLLLQLDPPGTRGEPIGRYPPPNGDVRPDQVQIGPQAQCWGSPFWTGPGLQRRMKILWKRISR